VHGDVVDHEPSSDTHAEVCHAKHDGGVATWTRYCRGRQQLELEQLGA
jgi:hypothetical protein